MSLVFNMVGGGSGGFSATDAVLHVQAPAGSTATISKGGTTKSDAGHENADNSSIYDYYFAIKASQFDSVNPWTVTATLGNYTASDTIIIDSADGYDLALDYTLWLIRDGSSEFGTITAAAVPALSTTTTAYTPTISYYSSYVEIGYSSSASTGGGGIGYWSDSKIDLSKYSKIHIDGTVRNPTSYTTNAGLSLWTAIGSNQTQNRILFAEMPAHDSTNYVSYSMDIDISTLTDLAYCGLKVYRGTSGYVVIRVENCYFEV